MHAIDLALLTALGALYARASTIHAAVAERQLARRPRRRTA
jgi:hypothetical protein